MARPPASMTTAPRPMVRSSPSRPTSRVAMDAPVMKAERAEGEDRGEAERRQAVEILQDECGGRQPAKQAGIGRRDDSYIQREAAMAEQRTIGAERSTRREIGSVPRFCSVSGNMRQTIRVASSPKPSRPAKAARQPKNMLQTGARRAARDTGASAMSAAHQRQFPPGARAAIEVAHDRAREHNGAGAAKGLQEAGTDQNLDRARQRANQARERNRAPRPRAEPAGGRAGRITAHRRSARRQSRTDRWKA